MTSNRPTRFSVLTMLLAAGIAFRLEPLAHSADPGQQPQAAITASQRFVLTVLAPDGKVLPNVPVEIRCDPAVAAVQVREGKFLRTEADAVLVEASASGRVVLELPADIQSFECLVEAPGFAARLLHWSPSVSALEPLTLHLTPAWSV